MKRFAFCLVLPALVLAGCAGKTTEGKSTQLGSDQASKTATGIEGKWTAAGSGKAAKQVMGVEFAAPDKVTMAMDVAGGAGKINIVGTYKLEGEELTIIATDVSLDATGPRAASAKQRFEQVKGAMLKDLSQSASGKVAWVDNDKFTLTAGKNNDLRTFTRVK